MTKVGLFAVLSLVVVSQTAARADVIYTLEDVNFTNGATASGSFYYNELYSNIDITISGSFPAILIQYASPPPNAAEGGTSDPFELFGFDSDAADLTGANFLDISFLGSLYQGEGFFLEGEDPISAAYGTCTNSICSTIDTAAVTPGPGDGGGALVTTDPGAYTGPGANTGITPVPEPSSLSMLVLSFVGLAGGFFFKARQNGLLLKT